MKRAGMPNRAASARAGLDGRQGEVEPGEVRPGAGEGQAVMAEMALQMQHPQAGHGAELGGFDRMEEGGAVAMVTVAIRDGPVDRNAFVPACPV